MELFNSDDCNANVKGNAGCSYAEQATNSYGKGFNDAGATVPLAT